MATEFWTFAPHFDHRRRERLVALLNFEAVAAMIEQSVQDLTLEPCWGRHTELRACVQPVFTLSISCDAFDGFFNSPVGYRAGYLESPDLGLLNNLRLVQRLIDRLLAKAAYECIADLAHINVRASLLATSCKAWLHEDDFDFGSPTEDLAIASWVAAARRGEKKAVWGLCAPKASRMQIKGALIDRAGNELVPRKKVLRRYELQSFGFS
jgi:hypothetical protein